MAEQHLQQALAIDRDIGYRRGEADVLGLLGLLYADKTELDKAEEYLKDALAIYREIGYRLGEANALGGLGLLAEDRGRKERAHELLQEALRIYEEIGAHGPNVESVRQALARLDG